MGLKCLTRRIKRCSGCRAAELSELNRVRLTACCVVCVALRVRLCAAGPPQCLSSLSAFPRISSSRRR